MNNYAMWVVPALCFLLMAPGAALAAPRAASGGEMAKKAAGVKLHKDRAIVSKFQQKTIRFTPAELATKDGQVDFDGGVVLGVLENAAEGDETGLPPGKYNLFAQWVGNKVRVFAESGGKVVKEALRVKLAKETHKPADVKASKFIPKGWGFYLTYYPYGSTYSTTSSTSSCTTTLGTSTCTSYSVIHYW